MNCDCGGLLYYVGTDADGRRWYCCCVCGHEYSK